MRRVSQRVSSGDQVAGLRPLLQNLNSKPPFNSGVIAATEEWGVGFLRRKTVKGNSFF